ncbi:hypothetical protein, variant [Phytophthora nicotianae P1976]|uniref:PiggyBac transposable element-derived protein domain-containing protein n=1 Tax=Phytophthora nicotianae P1976 TaxID=1317066 RepID=A0A081B208_PHYNI|nr:hypothetical protein F444_00954 [Phytophthora nicotianae P1976]ETO85169.1 hypothetical protein, variant [Phytophthora nicotianae P1976]
MADVSDSDLSADDLYLSDTSSEGSDEDTRAWRYVDADESRVEVDDTDAFLLASARDENRAVVNRLLLRMFGTTQHHTDNVDISRFVYTWLDSSVLIKLQTWVNCSMTEDAAVSVDDLYRFMKVELWLSFYHATPEAFYDKFNLEQYPVAARVLPAARHRSILAALGEHQTRDDRADRWTAPLSQELDIDHAAELVRRLCSDIGYVEGVTIASLDDDMIRLRSTAVDDIGLAHIRNPKKGYGPVQHGIVSLVTGIFLGGHVANRGESTVDIVRLLQRALCGAPTESQIHLPGVLHALDRGYQSLAVNKQIINVGGSIVGTHKRTGKFPFTHGKAATQHQKLVQMKGERCAFWATQRLPTVRGTLSKHAHALAYRNGLGKVALCYTAATNVGPGTWSYISRPNK